ncbi:monoacylglycerol lipase-like [Dioscorea cayenensis subsp. rotundata]|uniref:Monoacylglycerol lipase-like n=1 Tax=Dioscorea cayennensis subsp. rotundata TaxID=55577 RepID=A0AB40BJX0_DIOCR|nr:monoacylglycerol lipase-like [Dioscorea cayenensis subsp. rotundata]
MICIGKTSVPAVRIPVRSVPKERIRIGRRSPGRMETAGVVMRSPAVAAVAATPLMLTSGASGRVNALLSLRVLRSLLLLLNSLILFLLLPFRRRARFVAAAERPSSGVGEDKKGAVVVRVPAGMVARRRGSEGEAAVRRAMAIRRVGVREEKGEEKRSKREFAMFSTARGDSLFTQSWTPVVKATRGLVVLMHGLNEHSGRYNHFATQLNDHGFKVYAMDWIGHGGSDGLHGYVPSLDYAVSDLKAFLEKVLTNNPGLPCFCFGHSTGGAIVLKAVLDPNIESRIQGVVLTSPAIHVQPSHPIIVKLAPIISLIAPKYQFTAASMGPPVSRDPEALKAKYSDPLVFTGSIRVRTGYEILRITSYLQQNLSKVKTPFLVLHGNDDTITAPEASRRLYEEASSSDKSIKLYEGLLHDLLFEPEKEEIAKDIIDWLCSRLDDSSRELER